MNLEYRDSDGVPRTVDGVKVTQGKCGRWWVWSEQLKVNLAYKEKSLDDALKASIASLLFYVHLKDNRIQELQVISDAVDELVQKVTKESE